MSKRDWEQKGHLPGRRSTSSRYRKAQGPPKDQQWVGLPQSLLESDAMSKLRLTEERLLKRLYVEHLRHGRKENGRLEVSHRQFIEAGCRGASINAAVDELVRRGLIAVTEVGNWRNKQANRYRLTFFAVDGEFVTNEWRKYKASPRTRNGSTSHPKRRRETPSIAPETEAPLAPVSEASLNISGWVVGGGAWSTAGEAASEAFAERERALAEQECVLAERERALAADRAWLDGLILEGEVRLRAIDAAAEYMEAAMSRLERMKAAVEWVEGVTLQ